MGLLKSDSSKGIWEISEKGVKYLEKEKKPLTTSPLTPLA